MTKNINKQFNSSRVSNFSIHMFESSDKRTRESLDYVIEMAHFPKLHEHNKPNDTEQLSRGRKHRTRQTAVTDCL